MTIDRDDVAKAGVSDAWDFWLSQHPVTVADIIEKSVKDTFSAWLLSREGELQVPGADAVCPVCAKGTLYAPTVGLHYHRDGTDSRACWQALLVQLGATS